MAQTETRHTEMSSLFKLLLAQETGDIYTQIAHTKATMEPEDIESVMKEFDEWKLNRPVLNKTKPPV